MNLKIEVADEQVEKILIKELSYLERYAQDQDWTDSELKRELDLFAIKRVRAMYGD